MQRLVLNHVSGGHTGKGNDNFAMAYLNGSGSSLTRIYIRNFLQFGGVAYWKIPERFINLGIKKATAPTKVRLLI